MIPHSTSIHLGRKNDHGLYRARFRVRWNSQRNEVAVTIPFLIDDKRFITSESRCRKNSFHDGVPSATINRLIESYEHITSDIFQRFYDDKKMPTNAEFRAALTIELSPEQTQAETICEVMERYIREQSIACSWSRNTIQNETSVLTNIRAHFPKSTMTDLNESLVIAFVKCLINEGYKNDTTKKKLKQLSAFARWANKKGCCNVDSDIFHVKLKAPAELKEAIIYLEWEEIMRIMALDLHGVIEEIRDMFCLGCFTGLRYSDLIKLRQKHIYADSVHVITTKTSKPVTIELNDHSRSIVNKYQKSDPDELLFYTHPNQVCNRYLKDIARRANIDTMIQQVHYVGNSRVENTEPKYNLLTMHAARRTFVVTALTLGIEPSIIMRWTGHRNYEAMKPYIAIVERTKRAAMDRFNQH